MSLVQKWLCLCICCVAVILLSGCFSSSLAFEEMPRQTVFTNTYPFKFYVRSIKARTEKTSDSFDIVFDQEYYRNAYAQWNVSDATEQIRRKLINVYPDFFSDSPRGCAAIDVVLLAKGANTSWDFTFLFCLCTLGILPGINYVDGNFSICLDSFPDAKQDFIVSRKDSGGWLNMFIPHIQNHCYTADSVANDSKIVYYTGAFESAPPLFLALFPSVILSADKKQLTNLFISQQGGIKLDSGVEE